MQLPRTQQIWLAGQLEAAAHGVVQTAQPMAKSPVMDRVAEDRVKLAPTQFQITACQVGWLISLHLLHMPACPPMLHRRLTAPRTAVSARSTALRHQDNCCCA